MLMRILEAAQGAPMRGAISLTEEYFGVSPQR
jgi:hypothetical protein